MSKICNVAAPINFIGKIEINRSKPCHTSNYTNVSSRNIEYLVYHYTGNSKDTAKANANYFMGANRWASAHYIVDNTSIWQSVDINDRAWHCGTDGDYYHNHCRNANSIGIEMCCTAGNYKIGDKAKENAAQLGAALCKYFGITDVDTYVIRHYDVTHKICPAQMVNDNSEWIAFKSRIKEILNGEAPTKTFYRVRKSWKDGASQRGAYSVLTNAISACDKAGPGYYVFDESGTPIYPDNAICTLVKKKIINTPNHWVAVKHDLKYLDVLLDKIAESADSKVIGSVKTAKDAIEHLVKCDVINDKNYWLANYTKVKYLDKLLISATNHISSKFTAYKVKVTVDALNIRKGPGIKHDIVGCIRDKGTYTIVDEESGWGLLKSYVEDRNGWISLAYTKKV